MDNDIAKRMQSLLAGEVISDNNFVDYALGKMRECQARKKEVMDQLNKAQQNMKLLEMQLLAVDTEFEKYGDDVAHFDSVLQKLMENEIKEVHCETAMEVR